MVVFKEIPLDQGAHTVCRRCAPGSAVKPEYPDVAEIGSRLDAALATAPVSGVLFTGSDPLGHPGLEQLVDRVAGTEMRRIGVRTPGSGLADPVRVSRLIESGIRLFEIPFLGSHAQLHDSLAGVPGSYEAAVRAVGDIRAAAGASGARVAIRALLGVCRHTVQDLPAAVMSLAELEVTCVVLSCADTSDSRRYAEWIAAACDTGTVNRVWVSVSGLPAGSLGDKALHAIDPMTVEGAAL